MCRKLVALLFLLYLDVCFCDYYWRDYHPSITKEIPSDAIVGGRDANDDNIFIGQLNNWGNPGMQTGTISAGKEVWSSHGGPKKATESSFIQILCSENPQQFKWVPATHNDLQLVGLNTNIVRGGMHERHITYIGRVKHQGNVIIGRVFTHDVNSCLMFFVYNNREYVARAYEILTYDK